MKYLKRFNEELKPETYINAANKIKYNHPERANKLREYGKSLQDKGIFDKEWDFLVFGDYTGTVTAKLRPFDTTTGYYFEKIRQDVKLTSKDGYASRSTYKPSIGSWIHITKNGLSWGGDNMNGKAYLTNRKDALELKEVLSELGYEISVNDLYTEREPDQGFEWQEPRKPWYRRS